MGFRAAILHMFDQAPQLALEGQSNYRWSFYRPTQQVVVTVVTKSEGPPGSCAAKILQAARRPLLPFQVHISALWQWLTHTS